MTHRFETALVSGRKRPYNTWTFLIVPPEVAKAWGPGQIAVRGTIAGHAFQGTATRGEGALRVPIPRDFRDRTKLGRGDTVPVALEQDTTDRTIPIPKELRSVFQGDPEVAALYRELPPSMRRAWASWVADAKRAETRARRAGRAPEGIRAREFPR